MSCNLQTENKDDEPVQNQFFSIFVALVNEIIAH